MPRGSLPFLALAACTGGMHDPSTVEQQNGACVALEGRTFISVGELECGLAPPGEPPALCRWQLVFSIHDPMTSELQWNYSDVVESGRAACRGQAIESTLAGARTVTGTFDPKSQMLVWDGVAYTVAP